MTLDDLLNAKRLQRHSTSSREITNLLRLVERGLADAEVDSISTDLRFCAAYNAALSLATMPLCCAGYRTRGAGHHATTFEALPLVMGQEVCEMAAYLNVCRSKRNVAEYRRSGEIVDEEVEELVASVRAFREQVEQWLRINHPELTDDT